MLQNKNTKFLSEINVFFTSSEKATSKIFEVYSSLKLYKLNIVKEEFAQAKYPKCNLLLAFLLFPIFEIHTVHSYLSSELKRLIVVSKNTLYRLKNDNSVNWRLLVSNINRKLLYLYGNTKPSESSENEPKCFIIDDTDFEKTGFKIEGIGKIWSHVKATRILGFKGLFLGYWDGTSFFGLDFSLHREKGKNKQKPYGLSLKQKKEQFSKKRTEQSFGSKRKKELNINKIDNMIKMLRRAFKRKLAVDYLLVDSWFSCHKLIEFVKTKPVELIGMLKMAKAKYEVSESQLTAKEIVKQLQKSKKVRWNKAINMYSTDVVVTYKGNALRLYFCKTSKRGKWHLLVSTNTKLNVTVAYRIYSIRWTIEVFFKESKNYFGLGKCQSQDFDAQIADISISMILYNIFSTLKKFNYYQTMGGLFSTIKEKVKELTIWQKIWNILMDFLKIVVSIVDGNFNDLVYRILKSDEKDNEMIKLLELKLSHDCKETWET